MSLKLEMVEATAAIEGLGALGVPVVTGPDGPQLPEGLPAAACGFALPAALDPDWCTRQGFSAKVGQVLVLRASDGPARMLVGLGPAFPSNAERWRRASAAYVRAAGDGGTAAFVLPGIERDLPLPEIGSAVAEGAALAAYRYTRFKTRPGAGPIEALLVTVDGVSPDVREAVGRGVQRGSRIGEAVSVARDMVNTPPSHLTPSIMADWALDLLRDKPSLRIQVWDDGRIKSEGLGGLLGVSAGSAERPRLLRVDFDPAKVPGSSGQPAHVALVGKGITFDSGGLSLKSPDSMMNQKTDMSGAAAVLAAMSACPDVGVPVKVTAFVPLAENMPGGNAIKPGDVVTTRNLKTIEVLNTDAEGRLILADALALATEANVEAIVDLATLTGAATVALGPLVAALFSNSYELLGKVRRAAGRSGEQVWPMPMPEDYSEFIDSDVADMKNTGKAGQAGAISAAMLLANFVGTKPWAHLDIAGPARCTEASGYLTKGGTGFGVRTLIEFLSTYNDET